MDTPCGPITLLPGVPSRFVPYSLRDQQAILATMNSEDTCLHLDNVFMPRYLPDPRFVGHDEAFDTDIEANQALKRRYGPTVRVNDKEFVRVGSSQYRVFCCNTVGCDFRSRTVKYRDDPQKLWKIELSTMIAPLVVNQHLLMCARSVNSELQREVEKECGVIKSMVEQDPGISTVTLMSRYPFEYLTSTQIGDCRRGLKEKIVQRQTGLPTPVRTNQDVIDLQGSLSIWNFLDEHAGRLPITTPLTSFDQFCERLGLASTRNHVFTVPPISNSDIQYARQTSTADTSHVIATLALTGPLLLWHLQNFLFMDSQSAKHVVLADGNQKVINGTYYLLSFGTQDIDYRPTQKGVTRSFRSLLHVLCPSESKEITRLSFRLLNHLSMRLFNRVFPMDVFIADSSRGLQVGSAESHPTAERLICAIHLKRNVRVAPAHRAQMVEPKKYQQKISFDVWKVSIATTRPLFHLLFSTTLLSWNTDEYGHQERYVDFFRRNYGPQAQNKGNWFLGAVETVGVTADTQAVESLHRLMVGSRHDAVAGLLRRNVDLRTFVAVEAIKLVQVPQGMDLTASSVKYGSELMAVNHRVSMSRETVLGPMCLLHQAVDVVPIPALPGEMTSTWYVNSIPTLGRTITNDRIRDHNMVMQGVPPRPGMTKDDIFDAFYCLGRVDFVHAYGNRHLSTILPEWMHLHCSCSTFHQKFLCHHIVAVHERHPQLAVMRNAIIPMRMPEVEQVYRVRDRCEQILRQRGMRSPNTAVLEDATGFTESDWRGLFLGSCTSKQLLGLCALRRVVKNCLEVNGKRYRKDLSKRELLPFVIAGTRLGETYCEASRRARHRVGEPVVPDVFMRLHLMQVELQESGRVLPLALDAFDRLHPEMTDERHISFINNRVPPPARRSTVNGENRAASGNVRQEGSHASVSSDDESMSDVSVHSENTREEVDDEVGDANGNHLFEDHEEATNFGEVIDVFVDGGEYEVERGDLRILILTLKKTMT